MTNTFQKELDLARGLIRDAERIVVGVGAGLSAAGGLDYGDPALAERWFPGFYEIGLRTIRDMQKILWWFEENRPEVYWGYWGQHIFHIRYETPVLKPYADLAALLEGKDYFICTTNADGQVQKAGFPKERIFAPQGDYCYFQCSKPCSDDLTYNEEMIRTMVEYRMNEREICTEDVPMCPRCGAYLVPNLRVDDKFVEEPHLRNLDSYTGFLEGCAGKKTVLLELGVGYNTPGIIRHPFERLARERDGATLIRCNLDYPDTPKALGERGISIPLHLAEVMEALAR